MEASTSDCRTDSREATPRPHKLDLDVPSLGENILAGGENGDNCADRVCAEAEKGAEGGGGDDEQGWAAAAVARPPAPGRVPAPPSELRARGGGVATAGGEGVRRGSLGGAACLNCTIRSSCSCDQCCRSGASEETTSSACASISTAGDGGRSAEPARSGAAGSADAQRSAPLLQL
mmetsp:Transcript_53038/g.134556  ORF Transcript_53038/g.134556 Transcript_53038/m.134556 type:complete len:176 (-) Transcript_53038:382-909(-)